MFILRTSSPVAYILDPSPDGWDESLITWERSDKYWGVFRTWTIPLKFVKTGATEIRREFYTYGMKSYTEIEIQKYDKVNLTWYKIFTGTLDYSTFKDTPDYVEVAFVDSGAAKILKDYGDNEYQIGVGQQDAYGYTEDVIYTGSGTYYGTELLDLAELLFDAMSGGKVIGSAPTIRLQSDFLTDYEYQTSRADEKIVLSPGVQFRVGHVHPGKTGYFRTSFNDWWKTVNSLFNLGIGIEYGTGGIEIVRIEPKEYFFQTGVVVDFGTVKNVSVNVTPKYAFKALRIGYPAQTYERNKHGYQEQEINGTMIWEVKSEVSGDELDLVSKYRGDGFGILDIYHSEVDSYDEDIFLVQIYDSDGEGTWLIDDRGKAKIGIGGTEYDLRNSLITPRRNLARWVDFFSSCFFGMAGEELRSTSSDYQTLYALTATASPADEWESAAWEITSPDWFFPVVFEIEVGTPADLIANMLGAGGWGPTSLYQFRIDGIAQSWIGHILKVDAKISGKSVQKITLLANASTGFAPLIDRHA